MKKLFWLLLTCVVLGGITEIAETALDVTVNGGTLAVSAYKLLFLLTGVTMGAILTSR